jgi:hypothetical protein
MEALLLETDGALLTVIWTSIICCEFRWVQVSVGACEVVIGGCGRQPQWGWKEEQRRGWTNDRGENAAYNEGQEEEDFCSQWNPCFETAEEVSG